MSRSKSPIAVTLLWKTLQLGVVLIPLVVSPSGKDNFRLPKELLFRAEIIVLLSIGCVLFLTKGIRRPRNWTNPELIIPTIIILWCLISMLAATNRAVSFVSFLWVAGWALIFLTTTLLARTRRLTVVYAAIIPAAVNAGLVLLQEAGIWNPFFPGKSLEHVYHTGLIGNPNDLGAYIVAPTLACLALTFASRSRRLLHGGATLFLLTAAISNHTLTALAALVAGFLAIVFAVSRRQTIVAVIATAILSVALLRVYPPLRTRYELATRFAAAGNYDSVLSGRTLPFIAASQMFQDRPLVGVGPGCFKWQYFPYKLRISKQLGTLPLNGTTINYGEVHNDHLQILAETGLPGYILFVWALIAIAISSITTRGAEELTPEEQFSRIASLPLVVAFAVLALGQFPLELSASLAANVYLFALCRAWKPSASREAPL